MYMLPVQRWLGLYASLKQRSHNKMTHHIRGSQRNRDWAMHTSDSKAVAAYCTNHGSDRPLWLLLSPQ